MSSSTAENKKPDPPVNRVKKRMRETPRLCTKCRKEEPGPGVFKRCGNCKYDYCSQECQKADWPQHKAGCRLRTAQQSDLAKLANDLVTHPILRPYLDVLLVLELDLLNDPSGADRIYHTEVVVDFEPAKVRDFKALFQPTAVIDSSPLQGMLQIGAIFHEPYDTVPWETISKEMIDQKREEISRERTDVVWVGAVQWLRDVGPHVCFANNIIGIGQESIEIARKIDLHIPVQRSPTGKYIFVRKPADVFTHIEFINALIRLGTGDESLLRINLTAEDKRLIQYAAVNWQQTEDHIKPLSKTMFLNLWTHKALRESVFNNIYARFEQ